LRGIVAGPGRLDPDVWRIIAERLASVSDN
jgi:hypothetical protein